MQSQTAQMECAAIRHVDVFQGWDHKVISMISKIYHVLGWA
jgi:hypothetical protein